MKIEVVVGVVKYVYSSLARHLKIIDPRLLLRRGIIRKYIKCCDLLIFGAVVVEQASVKKARGSSASNTQAMDYSAPSVITLTSHLLFVVCLTVTINGGGGLSANSSRQQFYDLADFPLHSIIPFRDPYYASDNYWHSRGPVPPPATAQFKIRTNEYRQQQLESSFSAAAAAAAAAVAETRQGAAFGGGNKGFGTLTLTLGSTYSTFTVTTTTTCTTSTANIKVCSPSKGRRRRSNFGIHRLMFDEEEFDESAIFAPRKTEDDQLQR